MTSLIINDDDQNFGVNLCSNQSEKIFHAKTWMMSIKNPSSSLLCACCWYFDSDSRACTLVRPLLSQLSPLQTPASTSSLSLLYSESTLPPSRSPSRLCSCLSHTHELSRVSSRSLSYLDVHQDRHQDGDRDRYGNGDQDSEFQYQAYRNNGDDVNTHCGQHYDHLAYDFYLGYLYTHCSLCSRQLQASSGSDGYNRYEYDRHGRVNHTSFSRDAISLSLDSSPSYSVCSQYQSAVQSSVHWRFQDNQEQPAKKQCFDCAPHSRVYNELYCGFSTHIDNAPQHPNDDKPDIAEDTNSFTTTKLDSRMLSWRIAVGEAFSHGGTTPRKADPHGIKSQIVTPLSNSSSSQLTSYQSDTDTLAGSTHISVSKTLPSKKPRYDSDDRKIARKPVYAAIDMGSNCCRLLLAVPTTRRFKVVGSYSKVVGVAVGVAEHGVISSQSMQRALNALNDCAQCLSRYQNIAGLRAVATAAFRQASNGAAFLDRIRSTVGLPLHLIDSREEARLVVLSCIDLLRHNDYFMLIDIGGASTELIIVHARKRHIEIIDCISLPVGVVSMAEKLGVDTVSDDVYRNICDSICDQIEPFVIKNGLRKYAALSQLNVLSTSGTATTLVAMTQKLERYQRHLIDGTFIGTKTIYRLAEHMRGLTMDERSKVPSVGRNRSDAFVAGCVIIEAICRSTDTKILQVADRGLREGILLELMGHNQLSPTVPSVSHGI